MWRSEPQMTVDEIFTLASVASNFAEKGGEKRLTNSEVFHQGQWRKFE